MAVKDENMINKNTKTATVPGALLLCFLLLCTLTSCTKRNYRDDADTDDLAEQMTQALANEKRYTKADDDVLDGYFTMPSYVTESTVRFSSDGNDLDEFGVYHVTEGNTEDMAKHLRAYVTDFYNLYNANYLPEELPKLRDAEVRTFGNYVVYAMLDKNDRETVFAAVESALAP